MLRSAQNEVDFFVLPSRQYKNYAKVNLIVTKRYLVSAGSLGNSDGHPWGQYAWADLHVFVSQMSVGFLLTQCWRYCVVVDKL